MNCRINRTNDSDFGFEHGKALLLFYFHITDVNEFLH